MLSSAAAQAILNPSSTLRSYSVSRARMPTRSGTWSRPVRARSRQEGCGLPGRGGGGGCISGLRSRRRGLGRAPVDTVIETVVPLGHRQRSDWLTPRPPQRRAGLRGLCHLEAGGFETLSASAVTSPVIRRLLRELRRFEVDRRATVTSAFSGDWLIRSSATSVE
jgi:hypothetical protein